MTVKNKAIFVSEDLHQKIKVLASMERQTMKDWVEWVIDKAYESAMHNRAKKEEVS